MRRSLSSWVVVPLVAVASLAVPARADAITLQEIIEMTRAGLGDEVLLALIEVDQRVFPVDTETLSLLKRAGVSEKVIVAMVKSGRTPPPPAPIAEPLDAMPPEPPDPQVIVIEHERPVVQEVAVPVPVYVPVRYSARYSTRPVAKRTSPTAYPRTPFNPLGPIETHIDATVDTRPAAEPAKRAKTAEPVYRGWGGKRRPDSWDPK